MTTINLRDGLEALYYFGEQDFDPQRNLLQDHSGYGRHAKAGGGITIPSDDGSGNEVGANGPNDFSATSLDGTDDQFDVGTPLTESGAQTVFALAKTDVLDGAIHEIAANDSSNVNDGFQLRISSNDVISFTLADSANQASGVSSGLSTDQWYAIVGWWDVSTQKLIVDGEEKDSTPLSDHATSSSNLLIGDFPQGGSNWQGDIATVARWSRALTWAEIQYLNNLTAPRRAML